MDIKEKVESELKIAKSMCETMENAIKSQIDKGLDKVNTHELYEAVDIYKDLSEVKKNIIEGCYKMQIMKAMEDSEYGVDYDENGEIRYYQPRSKTSGRFMSRGDGRREYDKYPAEYYRDMDREVMRRMYTPSTGETSRSYTDGYSDGESKGYSDGENKGYNRGYSEGDSAGYQRGYREGSRSSSNNRYERARRNYEEAKASKTGNQAEDSQREMKELEKMLNAFEMELTELLPKMSQSERNLAKNKVLSWQSKVQ